MRSRADYVLEKYDGVEYMIAGVDTSSKAVHVVVVDLQGNILLMEKFVSKEPDSDERFFTIHGKMAASWLWAYMDFIAIEKPIYIQNPQSTVMLSKMVASTQLVVYDRSLAQQELVGNTTWKKEVVGTGRAKKEDILAWAENHSGQVFEEQDFADAYCIALWGVKNFPKNIEARIP